MTTQLDKYARDAITWKSLADVNYDAAQTLFLHAIAKPGLYFVAVTLGHVALEMLLKTALICSGMTALNPKSIKSLDPSIGLKPDDCVWGHDLVALAKTLATRRPDFDLSAEMHVRTAALRTPMTVEEGFELFNPFFSELRYPQELKNIAGFGEDEGLVLEELACRIEPFITVKPNVEAESS
jgi:hypothetical protein